MALFKYMGLGHTRCRVSAESGDSVKVVYGEVVDVELGSHPELTADYFARGGFVQVASPEGEAPAPVAPEPEAVPEMVAEPEAEPVAEPEATEAVESEAETAAEPAPEPEADAQ